MEMTDCLTASSPVCYCLLFATACHCLLFAAACYYLLFAAACFCLLLPVVCHCLLATADLGLLLPTLACYCRPRPDTACQNLVWHARMSCLLLLLLLPGLLWHANKK